MMTTHIITEVNNPRKRKLQLLPPGPVSESSSFCPAPPSFSPEDRQAKTPAPRRAAARGFPHLFPSPVWRTPEDRQPAVETYRSESEPHASAPKTPQPSPRPSVPW